MTESTGAVEAIPPLPLGRQEDDSKILKNLHRIDQRTWSYRVPQEATRDGISEIRIETPQGSAIEPCQFACALAMIFSSDASTVTKAALKKGFNFALDTPTGGREYWSFSSYPIHGRGGLRSLFFRLLDRIPFFHTIRPSDVVSLESHQIAPQAGVSSASVQFQQVFNLSEPYAVGLPDRMASRSFEDPFTKLSSKAFKTVEDHFVMEAKHSGSYRFKIDSAGLRLVKISPSEPVSTDENRAAVGAFRAFLLREYGWNFVNRLEGGYRLSFQDLIAEGGPLLPDHVSKANVVMNNIEISDVERLFDELKKMVMPLQESPPGVRASDWLASLPYGGEDSPLSLREARGLLRMLPEHATVAQLLALVRKIAGGENFASARELPTKRFNQLVEIIMPSDEERELSFTGREIKHMAVAGYNTMGEANIPNPFREFFELQHIFNDCRKKEAWDNYFELLGHVVAKKSLFRSNPYINDWRAGVLIPAPDSASGERRWYYNDSFIDDGQGNVNYSLFPASRHYRSATGKDLPMVKLYRSTNSDRNAINWQDSIAADLNPFHAPGSLDPKLASDYECEFFHNRTIPVWVAYLIASDHGAPEVTPDKEAEFIRKAGETFLEYIRMKDPEDATLIIGDVQSLMTKRELPALKELLTRFSTTFKERPEDKMEQDCVFVGHSLGGALAQFGTVFFTTQSGRVPMPGCKFVCASFDGPATRNSTNEQFRRFGHNHIEVLHLLNIGWDIRHQFEYGDIAPLAGGSHLGSTPVEVPEDSQWLTVSTKVLRPTRTATAKAVVTMPTHGRRFGLALRGKDYTATTLTPQKLYEFDHALWLRGDLAKTFGTRFCKSPVITEIFRRIIGLLAWRHIRALHKSFGNRIGLRSTRGVFAISEGHDASVERLTGIFHSIPRV